MTAVAELIRLEVAIVYEPILKPFATGIAEPILPTMLLFSSVELLALMLRKALPNFNSATWHCILLAIAYGISLCHSCVESWIINTNINHASIQAHRVAQMVMMLTPNPAQSNALKYQSSH
jgi:hypothetical protein